MVFVGGEGGEVPGQWSGPSPPLLYADHSQPGKSCFLVTGSYSKNLSYHSCDRLIIWRSCLCNCILIFQLGAYKVIKFWPKWITSSKLEVSLVLVYLYQTWTKRQPRNSDIFDVTTGWISEHNVCGVKNKTFRIFRQIPMRRFRILIVTIPKPRLNPSSYNIIPRPDGAICAIF